MKTKNKKTYVRVEQDLVNIAAEAMLFTNSSSVAPVAMICDDYYHDWGDYGGWQEGQGPCVLSADHCTYYSGNPC